MLGSSPQDKTLALIGRITEDGILSTEEVFEMAEFLNENEEACQVWPGDVLHEALLTVFEDGKLTDEEMDALAHLIQDIEKEAAESDEHTVWEELPSQGTPVYDLISLEAPTLPGATAKGKDSEGVKFELDLGDLSCNCEEWRNTRSHLPEKSPGRLCRHLVAELNKQKEELPDVNAVFSWLLGERTQRGKGTHPVEFWNLLVMDEGTCLVSFGSCKWAHIMVPIEEAVYDRFGFNFEERRWSYGRKPVGYQPVKEYINTIEIEG